MDADTNIGETEMIDDTKEYIIASAIWYKNGRHYPFQSVYGIDNGFVIGSLRHPMALAVCPANPYYQNIIVKTGTETLPFEWGDKWKKCNSSMTQQGFITSYGRFVDRKTAFKLALDCGQITRGTILKTRGVDIEKHDGDLSLFSEDIFRKQCFYTTVDDYKVISLFENEEQLQQ